jgi:hypothetical protein
MPHFGSYFCGAVKLEVSGAPEAMAIVIAVLVARGLPGRKRLEAGGGTDLTSGAEHVATFQKTELNQRQYCRNAAGT